MCYWDGETFTAVTAADGVQGTEAWDLFEDDAGHIWFTIEHDGVYCYDGATYRNYGAAEGLASRGVQTIQQDRDGRIWTGGHLGLYRLEGESFVNVTRTGPWE